MAAAAAAIQSAIPAARRNRFFTGTPEIYFAKAIDNSRLVKVEDPGRNREMKQFGTALAVLFMLVFTYAWQHFRAIEYGYQIESAKRELSNLTETNRALRLEDQRLEHVLRLDLHELADVFNARQVDGFDWHSVVRDQGRCHHDGSGHAVTPKVRSGRVPKQ